jgi:hypothetical protein
MTGIRSEYGPWMALALGLFTAAFTAYQIWTGKAGSWPWDTRSQIYSF